MEDFETLYKNMVAFDKFLGMDLTVSTPGHITYILEVKDHHLTAPDSAHGGVTAALMDATLGVAALSYAVTHGNLCATVEFKINYIKQVSPGSILIGEGQIKHTGKSLIVSEGNIRNKATGDLVATGLGTFSQYPIDKRNDVNELGITSGLDDHT